MTDEGVIEANEVSAKSEDVEKFLSDSRPDCSNISQGRTKKFLMARSNGEGRRWCRWLQKTCPESATSKFKIPSPLSTSPTSTSSSSFFAVIVVLLSCIFHQSVSTRVLKKTIRMCSQNDLLAIKKFHGSFV